jgi:hypothetical protein
MYYIGVDIGGTFTDCVLVDREGNPGTVKTLSTKDDPVSGVLAGLQGLPRCDTSSGELCIPACWRGSPVRRRPGGRTCRFALSVSELTWIRRATQTESARPPCGVSRGGGCRR